MLHYQTLIWNKSFFYRFLRLGLPWEDPCFLLLFPPVFSSSVSSSAEGSSLSESELLFKCSFCKSGLRKKFSRPRADARMTFPFNPEVLASGWPDLEFVRPGFGESGPEVGESLPGLTQPAPILINHEQAYSWTTWQIIPLWFQREIIKSDLVAQPE